MKLGFIGTGNMGSAIIKGYIAGNKNAEVYAYDADESKMNAAAKELGLGKCSSASDLVEKAEMVVLAVKPNIYDAVLEEIKDSVTDKNVIISIAAGISMKYIENFFENKVKVIRVMPNTPSTLNEGAAGLCCNDNVSDAEFASVLELFKGIGKAVKVEESLMNAVVGVSGSSPAYAYMFIEAIAEASIKNGIEKEIAYELAAQSVLGAAKMVLETGIDTKTLTEMVCSPGGATIEAVNALKSNGFMANVEEAVNAAKNKADLMTK